MVESLLKEYPNVLTLRVRMPIVEDLLFPRNFITKIIKYDKVNWLLGGVHCTHTHQSPGLSLLCFSVAWALCRLAACALAAAGLAHGFAWRGGLRMLSHVARAPRAQKSQRQLAQGSTSAHKHATNQTAQLNPTQPNLQVINIPNSMTVLPELLPFSIEMVGGPGASAASSASTWCRGLKAWACRGGCVQESRIIAAAGPVCVLRLLLAQPVAAPARDEHSTTSTHTAFLLDAAALNTAPTTNSQH